MLKTVFLLCICTAVPVLCGTCVNPQVSGKSFTTQDATIVTNIAYISDFTLKCDSGAPGPLYADLNGNLVPVSVVANGQYQVSWTEDIKSASRGNKLVRLFDEDGYSAVKKALRSGEDASSVQPLAEVIVNHPGAYNGPWLRSETVAVLVSLVVSYVAISFKLKVTA